MHSAVTPQSIEKTLYQGLMLHESGEIDQAQQQYLNILQQHPKHGIALHLFGLTLYQQERLIEADVVLNNAKQMIPRHSAVWADHGLVLLALDEFDAAEVSLNHAIDLSPKLASAWNNRGAVYQKLGRTEQAIADWQQALSIQPDYKEALVNLGSEFRQQHKLDSALECFATYREYYPDDVVGWRETAKTMMAHAMPQAAWLYLDNALQLAPEDAESELLCADLHCQMGQPEKAREIYRKHLHETNQDPMIVRAMATCCHQLGEFESALRWFQWLSQQTSVTAADWHGLGSCYLNLRLLNQALNSYRQAYQLARNNAAILHDLSIVLYHLQSHAQARFYAQKALALGGDQASVLLTLALLDHSSHRYSDAEQQLQQLTHQPITKHEAILNLAYLYLSKGEWRIGWEYFEQRRESAAYRKNLTPASLRLWQGEALSSQDHVLILAEQGIGDFIQFCRFLPLLEKTGAKITLEVPVSMRRLIEAQLWPYQLIVRGEEIPTRGWYCPMMSLARALQITPCKLAKISNVLSIPQRESKEKPLPMNLQSLKVGFALQGNPKHLNDRARSFPSHLIPTLLNNPQIEYFCLQPNTGFQRLQYPANVACPMTPQADFYETAQWIEAMDLVITVDTAVAHLAGELGKTVWILLAYHHDWRWLDEMDSTIWYPNARLFRQSSPNNWQDVILHVQKALEDKYAEIGMPASER